MPPLWEGLRTLCIAPQDFGGFTYPHVHVVRYDGVVHITTYTEGPGVVTVDTRSTPLREFRIHTRCDRVLKMCLGGHNRFTTASPTCVRCVGKPEVR